MVVKKLRPIRVEGNLAYITLTKGMEAVIDAADIPLVSDRNWFATVEKRTFYAASGMRDRIRLHRVITGAPEGMEVDHRDGDGLNNRRSNLRVATKSQNQCNAKKRTDNKSGRKGVIWRKDSCRWTAQIRLNGRLKHLGYFDDLDAAAQAYAKASNEMHGEFGRVA